MIGKILKNPVIGFVITRYATYVIQLINAILIAALLGPYYLGLWGFFNLIIQYLGQINLGISHSITNLISVKKSSDKYVSLLIGNSILYLVCLCLLVALLFLANYFFGLNIGAKYDFGNYAIYAFIIAICAYFSNLFSGICRVYGKLFEVAFYQSSLPIVTLVVLILFGNNPKLLDYLIYGFLISSIISTVIFLIKLPVKITLNTNKKLWALISKKGWHLFLYNMSFYFIVIATRSFVSAFYTVESFGFFTFAFSLANIILLITGALTFLLLPKLLNIFGNSQLSLSFKKINEMRSIYLPVNYLLVFVAILFFPFFVEFFPQYSGIFNVFVMLTLTVIITANGFGYIEFLMARGFERYLGFLSVSILVINLVLCYLLMSVVKVPLHLSVLGNMSCYFIYIFIIVFKAQKEIGTKYSIMKIFLSAFPISLLAPYVITLILVLQNSSQMYYGFPLLIFLIMNFKELFKLKGILLVLINKPKVLDI